MSNSEAKNRFLQNLLSIFDQIEARRLVTPAKEPIKFFSLPEQQALEHGMPARQQEQLQFIDYLENEGAIKKGYPLTESLEQYGRQPSVRMLKIGFIGVEISDIIQPRYDELYRQAKEDLAAIQSNGAGPSITKESHSNTPTFNAGIIRQGPARHDFRNREMLALITNLWKRRAHLGASGGLIREAQVIPKDVLMQELTLTGKRLKVLVDTFNRMMRQKGIGVVIKMPDKVYLEVKDQQ
jgi:hypothetical protein